MTQLTMTPERHAEQQLLVLRMIELLYGLVQGQLSREEVAVWARTIWPEQVGQGSPFLRHATAATVFDSIYHLDREATVREQDLRVYLRWLTEGEAFRGDATPFAVVRGHISDWMPTRAGEPVARFWVDGLGWHEGVQIACPATGRPLVLRASLVAHGDPPTVAVCKLASDDLLETVIDLFETFAIDDTDLVHLDAAVAIGVLPRWELWRLDDNGNEVLMETLHSCAKAVSLQGTFEARWHRQSYFVRPS